MNLFMNPEWIRAQEDLKISMQGEIGLMREMLSNLHHEEVVLLGQDRDILNSLLEERGLMIERLKGFRSGRDLAVKTLSELSPEEDVDLVSLELILADKGEMCEITLMLDQLITLTDKINQQNIRNHSLSAQVSHSIDIDHSHYHSWGHPEVPIRKLALMTLQRKTSQEGSEE